MSDYADFKAWVAGGMGQQSEVVRRVREATPAPQRQLLARDDGWPRKVVARPVSYLRPPDPVSRLNWQKFPLYLLVLPVMVLAWVIWELQNAADELAQAINGR